MSDDETRNEIEEIVNDEPGQEPVQEPVQEEEVKPVKAKSIAKAKAKPNIKITKEPVETIVEETIIEEPIEEKPKNNNKLKELVRCPACNLSVTVHTLKYIKNEDFAKGHFKKLKKKFKKKLKDKKSHLDYRSRSLQKQ